LITSAPVRRAISAVPSLLPPSTTITRPTMSRGSMATTAPIDSALLKVGVTMAALLTGAGTAYKLQRSPQLAQAAGGRSDKSAARNAWYAGPFQMSCRLCLVASPNV
jgi:hypothetical protein